MKPFEELATAGREHRHHEEIDVSIVIPLHDEEENVEMLYLELAAVLSKQPLRYEVIFVDDGGTDGTALRLARAAAADPAVSILELARRFGQSTALSAGFSRARGPVIVAMDGDLQSDPRDIPGLVAKLDDAPGWDIVSGWRKNRCEPFLSRRLPSLIANRLIGVLTRTREVHDFGCTLKAYRREVLEGVELFGEMHRFLAAICKWRGARIREEVVHHRPRIHGKSKYGLRRTVKVLLDLITVKFFGDYLTKPLYFFGKAAALTLGLCMVSLTIAILQKFGHLGRGELPLNRNVLVLFAMMLFLTSILLIMMGVISELLVRIYHQARSGSFYRVRRITRGGPDRRSTQGDGLEE